jgi:hypothetical protein
MAMMTEQERAARERKLARHREKLAARTPEEIEAARAKKREDGAKRRAAARARKPDESDVAQWARVEAVREKTERWARQNEALMGELGTLYRPPTRKAA